MTLAQEAAVPLDIVGLSKVTTRGKFRHWYHYAIQQAPFELALPYKIKGIKPVPTAKYEDLNPRKFAFQQWANRWQSSFGVGSSLAGMATSGLAAGILAKVRTVKP